MSQNIVEIKQNDSISKDSFPKKEVISDRNVTYPKESSGTKKIDLISLLLYLLVTLFISCVYLLLSNNSKISHNIDILSNEKHKDKNSIRSLMHKAIPSPKPNPMVGYERNVLLVTNYEPQKGKTSPDVLYNPNPQSPIPNPHFILKTIYIYLIKFIIFYIILNFI